MHRHRDTPRPLPLVLSWLLLAAAAKTGCADADLAGDRSPATGPTPERPSVVLVVADDQGWGDLGHHGNPNLATPPP